MRIISGIFKGKKILEPRDKKTRPLKDLTKESIFNIINHSNKFSFKLEKANVLDLFSGVGSFGIECLSRGAKKVVFIENYSGVLPILKKNLYNLKNISNFEIIEKNIFQDESVFKFDAKFDLIFFDPPYKTKNLEKIFTKIKNIRILSNNGIIILHRHKKEKDFFPSDFNILDEKEYGIFKIIFTSINL